MSKLVEEFRKEHEYILEQLVAVKRMDIHTMEGRNLLIAAKDKLLNHMKKEVEELYTKFKKLAESDPQFNNFLENRMAETEISPKSP